MSAIVVKLLLMPLVRVLKAILLIIVFIKQITKTGNHIVHNVPLQHFGYEWARVSTSGYEWARVGTSV